MANRTQIAKIAAEKRAHALNLRLEGLDYRSIAKIVGYKSTASAHEAVKKELAAIPKEAANELREVETTRLNDLQAAIWKQALNGDPAAIKTALNVMDQRAKLLGLYEREATDTTTVAVVDALKEFNKGLDLMFNGDTGYGSEYAGDTTIPDVGPVEEAGTEPPSM